MADAARARVLAPRRAVGVTIGRVVDGTPGRLVTAAGRDGKLADVDLRIGKHGSALAVRTDALFIAITSRLQAGALPWARLTRSVCVRREVGNQLAALPTEPGAADLHATLATSPGTA